MLLTPRTYRLAQVPDRRSQQPCQLKIGDWPELYWNESRIGSGRDREMLLVHQTGTVKVGELVR
jgi:hypothetical protein